MDNIIILQHRRPKEELETEVLNKNLTCTQQDFIYF